MSDVISASEVRTLVTELGSPRLWRPKLKYLIYAYAPPQRGCEGLLSAQESICRDYAERQGWASMGCFLDSSVATENASTLERLGFRRVVKVVKRWRLNVIVVASPDAVGPTSEDVELGREKIEKAGAELVIVSEVLAAREARKKLARA